LRIISFIILLPFLFLLSCTNKKKDNKEILILGGLLYLNSQKKVGDFNCNTSPSPNTFAEFRSAIDTLNTSAYKCSECHGVNTAQSNFIITNYSSAAERVNAGNPDSSVLYFKVKPGGSMNAYSNANVRQAIYCWIANGANP
jgi:hypothetical protein